MKLPGCSNVLPAGVLIENGTAFSGSDLSAPASMMTSKSASSGTPATTPSISSYAGLAVAERRLHLLTMPATSSRRSASSFA